MRSDNEVSQFISHDGPQEEVLHCPCSEEGAGRKLMNGCSAWRLLLTPPPPPCPRTALRKNQPLVPRSNSRITFFTRVVGFSCFW